MLHCGIAEKMLIQVFVTRLNWCIIPAAFSTSTANHTRMHGPPHGASPRSGFEQILPVEEEIALMGARLITANIKEMPIRKRILAREQAALDPLRRGMKQPAALTATE